MVARTRNSRRQKLAGKSARCARRERGSCEVREGDTGDGSCSSRNVFSRETTGMTDDPAPRLLAEVVTGVRARARLGSASRGTQASSSTRFSRDPRDIEWRQGGKSGEVRDISGKSWTRKLSRGAPSNDSIAARGPRFVLASAPLPIAREFWDPSRAVDSVFRMVFDLYHTFGTISWPPVPVTLSRVPSSSRVSRGGPGVFLAGTEERKARREPPLDFGTILLNSLTRNRQRVHYNHTYTQHTHGCTNAFRGSLHFGRGSDIVRSSLTSAIVVSRLSFSSL